MYTSSSRPFQHHLTWLHSSSNQTWAPDDRKVGGLVSQNGAHSWSRNTTRGFYIKFQAIPTLFVPKYKSRILFATKSAIPAIKTSEVSNLQPDPADGLKIPPRVSLSNFGSIRQCLTKHQPSSSTTRPPNDGDRRNDHSSNKGHGWSQNTVKGLHIKF